MKGLGLSLSGRGQLGSTPSTKEESGRARREVHVTEAMPACPPAAGSPRLLPRGSHRPQAARGPEEADPRPLQTSQIPGPSRQNRPTRQSSLPSLDFHLLEPRNILSVSSSSAVGCPESPTDTHRIQELRIQHEEKKTSLRITTKGGPRQQLCCGKRTPSPKQSGMGSCHLDQECSTKAQSAPWEVADH